MSKSSWIKRAARYLIRRSSPNPDLINVFEKTISPEAQGDLLDRIFQHPESTAGFSALADLHMQDEAIRRELETLQFSPGDAERLRQAADREIKAASSKREIRTRAVSLLRPAAAAAAVLMLVLVVVLIRQPNSVGDTARNGRFASFEALSPSGDTNINDIKFRWSYVRGAKHYRLEILDRELKPVFSQEMIEEEFYLPSGLNLEQLKSGRLYFWKVIAVLEGGSFIESGFQKFKISGT